MAEKLHEIVQILLHPVNYRAWSSLPELENPTSFGYFFKPEPDLNPIYYISSNPMKPEPEVETRGYPKCMKN